MQEVETQHVIEYSSAPPPGAFPAGGWPASRLRWGSILGGVAVFLAVALFLWAAAFAVIVLVSSPTAASMRGGGMAIWISAIAATVLGAVAGGWFAGRSIWGTSATWGAAHGFAVWAVSLLLAFGVQFFLFRGLVTAAMLHTMGVDDTAEEGQPQNQGGAEPGDNPAEAQRATQVAHDYFVAAGWSWVGTWLVAGLAATAAAAAGSTGVRRSFRGHVIRESERIHDPDRDLPLTHSTAE